jgi:hypothetical protein
MARGMSRSWPPTNLSAEDVGDFKSRASAEAWIRESLLSRVEQMLNAAQGGFYRELTNLTVRVAQIEGPSDSQRPLISFTKPAIAPSEESNPRA